MATWRYLISGVDEAMHAIDVRSDDDAVKAANAIAKVLMTAADFGHRSPAGRDLDVVIHDLEWAANRGDVDEAISAMYDWADRYLVWIEPAPTGVASANT